MIVACCFNSSHVATTTIFVCFYRKILTISPLQTGMNNASLELKPSISVEEAASYGNRIREDYLILEMSMHKYKKIDGLWCKHCPTPLAEVQRLLQRQAA